MITRKRRTPVREDSNQSAVREGGGDQILENARQSHAVEGCACHHPGIVEDELALDSNMQLPSPFL